MLEDSGEFYPFGAVILADGKFTAVGGYDGEEHPKPTDIYGLLAKAFQNQAQSGEILAAALAANVNIPAQYEAPVTDGLRVWLEGEGFSRFIYVPYKLAKKGFLRKGYTAQLFEPIAVTIDPFWFKPLSNA